MNPLTLHRARLRARPYGLKGRYRDRYATGRRPALDPGASTAPDHATVTGRRTALRAQRAAQTLTKIKSLKPSLYGLRGLPAIAPILTSMRLGWPLTGRSKEMRLIEAALSDRDCCGIVVCGAAGVGKSRIAREAMTSAASNGCEVRWVVATSSARALPLGALRSWVGPAGGDSLQLVRGVIESLTSAPDGGTVVVAVDDAPLLDDLSIFVVHQIVQGGGAKVVFTVRDGEPVPAAIQEVVKARQFDWLDLQPLSHGETDTLLSTTLGGSLDPGAAVRLWELTRGNVLYLRNIVEQEV